MRLEEEKGSHFELATAASSVRKACLEAASLVSIVDRSNHYLQLTERETEAREDSLVIKTSQQDEVDWRS